MSKSLYEEAIADAKSLKETAEQNAKNAIIEAVTPRIRSFIEEQLLGTENNQENNKDVLDTVITESIGSSVDTDNIVLDETALERLVEVFSGKKQITGPERFIARQAMQESFKDLQTNDKEKLMSVANKLNKTLETLEDSKIVNDVRVKKESSNMPKNDDILYEVDLNALSEAMRDDDMTTEGDLELDSLLGVEEISDLSLEELMKSDDMEENQLSIEEMEGMEDMEEMQDMEEMEEMEMMDEISHEEDADEAYLREALRFLNEDVLEMDLGDVDLPEDIVDALTRASISIRSAEEEMEFDLEAPEEEDLNEVFEIDAKVLKSELLRLRKRIREGKDFTKVKGIKDAKESAFGGSGSGKAGLKGAYGGTGGSKAGVKGAFGGGKESGDALKVVLNKLSEALKNERRSNRSLGSKLNEYRSAVETLREQLTDLNLFNAKLLYVNKLLQNKEVTPSQRKSIVESIDGARSLREVKLLYSSLVSSVSNRTEKINESNSRKALGSSSRIAGRSSSSEKASEVNRWAILAGINDSK